jgi:phosphomevalonate kinase
VSAARAPGKVVLSGAYAVLSGAPAIVSAVSRYVTADTARSGDFITDEVRAALAPGERAPWFEASALREHDRKLGLGSSAAILVASLFALERAAGKPASDELRQHVFRRALSAHRAAQGGGSGIDVAASTFGGTLLYELTGGAPRFEAVELPAGLCFEIWACPSSASTRELLGRVEALRVADPRAHAELLGAQAAASRSAAERLERGDAAGFLAALLGQNRALQALGRAAGAPILTADLLALSPQAEAEGGVLLPAGAGGGDIAWFVGHASSSPDLRAALGRRSHILLPLALSAPGVSDA